MQYSNDMADYSDFSFPPPRTSYPSPWQGHANHNGPYHQLHHATHHTSEYTTITRYSIASLPLTPPILPTHTPMRAPTYGGYSQDSLSNFKDCPLPAPTNFPQAAGSSPLPATPVPTTANANANAESSASDVKKRGRPKDSKNKPKDQFGNKPKKEPKVRGRPKGSLDKKPRKDYTFRTLSEKEDKKQRSIAYQLARKEAAIRKQEKTNKQAVKKPMNTAAMTQEPLPPYPLTATASPGYSNNPGNFPDPASLVPAIPTPPATPFDTARIHGEAFTEMLAMANSGLMTDETMSARQAQLTAMEERTDRLIGELNGNAGMGESGDEDQATLQELPWTPVNNPTEVEATATDQDGLMCNIDPRLTGTMDLFANYHSIDQQAGATGHHGSSTNGPTDSPKFRDRMDWMSAGGDIMAGPCL